MARPPGAPGTTSPPRSSTTSPPIIVFLIGPPARSRHSEISFHDWTGICAGDEAGYTAPDPLHPEILFGDNVTKCNVITGELRNVSPELSRQGPFRKTWTLPLVFSEAD